MKKPFLGALIVLLVVGTCVGWTYLKSPTVSIVLNVRTVNHRYHLVFPEQRIVFRFESPNAPPDGYFSHHAKFPIGFGTSSKGDGLLVGNDFRLSTSGRDTEYWIRGPGLNLRIQSEPLQFSIDNLHLGEPFDRDWVFSIRDDGKLETHPADDGLLKKLYSPE